MSPDLWLSNSPDLNTVDYNICGCLQDRMSQKCIRDISELKQHPVEVWSDLWQLSLMRPSMSGGSDFMACIHVKERHFEHLL